MTTNFARRVVYLSDAAEALAMRVQAGLMLTLR